MRYYVRMSEFIQDIRQALVAVYPGPKQPRVPFESDDCFTFGGTYVDGDYRVTIAELGNSRRLTEFLNRQQQRIELLEATVQCAERQLATVADRHLTLSDIYHDETASTLHGPTAASKAERAMEYWAAVAAYE